MFKVKQRRDSASNGIGIYVLSHAEAEKSSDHAVVDKDRNQVRISRLGLTEVMAYGWINNE